MFSKILNVFKEKPRLALLVLTLLLQVLEATGVVVPPQVVAALNDLVTFLTGAYVAYKSESNSII